MLIGEVARRCGVSARMLRHYDRIGLVQPTGRTPGGYREYSADDIHRLFEVESLRTVGLSLADIRDAVDSDGFEPAAVVADLIAQTRRRIAAEEELLDRLERVDRAEPRAWEDVVRVVTSLRALGSASAARRQQVVLSAIGDTTLSVDELVQAMLTEDDPNVAGALQWSLSRAGDQGVAALAVALDDPDVEVRRRAGAALAELTAESATRALRRALADPADGVREPAALVLGARGVAEARPELVQMIVAGHRDVAAAEALGALAPGSDVVDLLGRHLVTATDPRARLRLTQALAEIPGADARDVLTRLIDDPDRAIAATAAAILG